MPVSFGLVRLDRFPLDGTHTTQQQALGDHDHGVVTVVENVLDWQHADFSKYRVRHESLLHLEGRYKNEPISEVIEVHRFDVYVSKDRSVAAPLAPKRIWTEAFHRLEKDPAATLSFQRIQLDLVKLRTNLEAAIGGGWFGSLKIDKVSTVGIFGADVAESDDWSRYEQSGTLQAVILELEFDDKPAAAMLGRDWTLVSYRNFGEVGNLEFLMQVRAMVEKALAP